MEDCATVLAIARMLAKPTVAWVEVLHVAVENGMGEELADRALGMCVLAGELLEPSFGTLGVP